MAMINTYALLPILPFLWAPAAVSSHITTEDGILPTYAIPSHYTLDLVLDPMSTNYSGFVRINFSAPTALHDVIQFHASQETIEIQYTFLNYNHSCNVTNYNNVSEIVTLNCPSRSFQVENILIIRFKGKISTEDLRGLYRSTYEEDDGEHVMLATRFGPAAARRAFPCLDEPKWKAVFDIFITHPTDYMALANTPIVNQFSVGPGQTQTQFKTTPPMSSYLVAFIVSKLVSNNSSSTDNCDYKVLSRPSAKSFTNIATTYGPMLTNRLSNWTGIEYKDLGNPQLYQVAMPDFGSVAMGSWGLIMYREVNLLDEGEITSNDIKQNIITTMAHELAYQWFGDYVTLEWWSDNWLAEGISAYFEYFIPDQLEDNLETMKQFVVKELQSVLQVDAVPSALPLSSKVESPAEYASKFDDISFSKGASIMRMLRYFLGETAFREGLQSYLKTYKYNNTNPIHLLNSFTIETPLGLDKIMDNWINKPGFPLVTAKLNGSNVVLTQQRFILESSDGVEATQWYVPISYTTNKERNFDIIIKDWLIPNSTVQIPVDKSWIIFNTQQAGYYRVNYDDTLWYRIIEGLKNERNKIDVLNRAQLIDDVFNIARAGKIRYQTAFHLVEFLSSETEYYPWVSALNAFSFINGKLDDDEAENLLKVRILYWLSKAFPKNYNFGSGHIDKLKEVLILDWACKLGQVECNTDASEMLQIYKNTHKLADYNKRRIVFCYGYRNSTNAEKDYDFLVSVFKRSKLLAEKYDVIHSLGCTQNFGLLAKYLAETINENSPFGKQYTLLILEAVFANGEVGIDVSLDFLENNLTSIVPRYKGTNAFFYLFFGLASEISSEHHMKRFTKIIEDNSHVEEINLIGEDAIYMASANMNWTKRYAPEIKKILQEPINSDGNIITPASLLLMMTPLCNKTINS